MTNRTTAARPDPRTTRRKAGFSAVLGAVLIGAVAGPVAGDTGPTLDSVSPNTVSSGADGLVLVVAGDGIGTSSLLQWRGTDHAIDFLVGLGDGSRLGTVIPAAELAIAGEFLTVPVTVSTGGAVSNPRSVTIVGSGISSAQSAIVGFGQTATVGTPLISATYTRAAAGFGRLTVADYFQPGSPPIIPGSPPISPVAYLDLQLLDAGPGDALVGTFLPPSPIIPTGPPIVPTPPPIYPTDPIRLAYWTGSSWAPVFGSGGVAPVFAFDSNTQTASTASVRFDLTSAPQITALGGTIFAFVTAYGFAGFSDPLGADVNVAKAGRTVPLKWGTYDLRGNPVTALAPGAVKVTSVRIACDTFDGQADPVEAYAPGSSGLQDLGNGRYQWNWATDKAWAGTCRLLRLDIGDRHHDGTPIYRTAAMQFTK